ncbi:halocarboxylic acid dehydrogenase DehI family protein [Novipirellula sp.]|uniref:halocarboxylic acid dehydrogenase DehI family protein n=1 Tax=Novipirellula sp. TaxID=2795430 RepID=UPI0035690FAF
MFGSKQPSPVAEYAATGEIERVYYEIGQTLRVRGINLIFRTWAGHKGLLPILWDTVRPNAETMRFEQSSDQIRSAAVELTKSLGNLDAKQQSPLGPSQAFQLHEMLKLYHYINPKLLLLASAVRQGLDGELSIKQYSATEPAERIAPGVPAEMAALEMEDENPSDEQLQTLFSDITDTLSLRSINSDYRSLALWPNYLDAVWRELKPKVQSPAHATAADHLRERSRRLASELPYPVPLSRTRLEGEGIDFDETLESCDTFEQLLPGLILNIAICLRDWQPDDASLRSPFPANAVSPRSQNSGRPEFTGGAK